LKLKIVDLGLNELQEAPWNSNEMDNAMLQRLRTSIKKYGLLGNLVVRPVRNDCYEVLSGNHRLRVLKELGGSPVPCVIVEMSDADAALLAQALNHVHGEEDLGLRATTIRKVLASISPEEVLSVLPDTAIGLKSLASLGKQSPEEYLTHWRQVQPARLKHLQFQLTSSQLEVVEAALNQLLSKARTSQFNNPNPRSIALFLLCKSFIEEEWVKINGK
jgi:ParB family transcriptional regulator, chromosome partitioning protein